jgi:hypothetical protein
MTTSQQLQRLPLGEIAGLDQLAGNGFGIRLVLMLVPYPPKPFGRQKRTSLD